MRTVSATLFRANMFQVPLQVMETGQPIVIAFARTERGKAETTLFKAKFCPIGHL